MYPDYEDDIDVESDEDSDDLDSNQLEAPMPSGNQYYSQADKRAHHNALERKRRDHIKDSFSNLRNSVPALQGEKASRAQILKKSADYIVVMKKRTNDTRLYTSDLKRTNAQLESQLKVLRNAKKNGTFPVEMIRNMTLESESDSSDESDDLDDSSDESESSSSSDEGDEITVTQHRTKRSRTGY